MYVKGTVEEGLGYSLGEKVVVWRYIDASYGSDGETKKRSSGYVFMSGDATVSLGSMMRWH